MSASLLVVDDSPLSLDSMSRHLRRKGYEVATADRGVLALDMVERRGFDLVLLDVLMPDLGGEEVLRRIRERSSETDLPVIIVTVQDQSEEVVRFLGQGANDYVTKPADLAVLYARIATQLRLKRLSQLKDNFMAIASHDLKSPLTTVMANAYVVQRLVPQGAPMTAEACELLEAVSTRARTMKRIVEDFLDFQILKDGQFELHAMPTDVSALVADCVTGHREHARTRGIGLVQDAAALPTVVVDGPRLAQVVENLVSNAVKFSPDATDVTVRAAWSDGRLQVEVLDQGPGIPAPEMERLFVRYARLSNRPRGGESSTGVGLVICKEIVERHGGAVGVRNNEGGGATFWFHVTAPLAEADEPAGARA